MPNTVLDTETTKGRATKHWLGRILGQGHQRLMCELGNVVNK